MSASSPEKNIGMPKGPENAPQTVSQPVRIESHMQSQLGSFLEDINRISESTGSGPGEQWSGGGSGTGMTQTQGGAAVVSARDLAIANLPAPAVMQKQLEKHIQDEVKKLRKETKRIARMGKPGAAYHLNQLYARIHTLNSLLSQIFEASYDVLKRMFVRVFIDRQPIL